MDTLCGKINDQDEDTCKGPKTAKNIKGQKLPKNIKGQNENFVKRKGSIFYNRMNLRHKVHGKYKQ